MKILMIGLGGAGQRHLRNLYRKFGNKLEILTYPKKKRIVLTDNFQIQKGLLLENKYKMQVFDTIQEALEKKPKAAFVSTPTILHVPIATRVAQAGCHLFIEKPLSDSMRNIKKLQTVCLKNKLIAMIGFQLRFNPALKLLKKKIQENIIGNLLSVHVDLGNYLPAWHPYENYRQLYAAKKKLGGGVVLTQMHEFDYLYWLFGLPKKVYALGGQLSNLQIDVEDTVDVLMKMEFNKKTLPVSVHLDYLQRPATRTCKIIGTDGQIILDLEEMSLTIQHANGQEKKYEYNNFNKNQMFQSAINHFFNCITRKAQPIVDLKASINSLKIALAVKKSVTKNKVIAIQ